MRKGVLRRLVLGLAIVLAPLAIARIGYRMWEGRVARELQSLSSSPPGWDGKDRAKSDSPFSYEATFTSTPFRFSYRPAPKPGAVLILEPPWYVWSYHFPARTRRVLPVDRLGFEAPRSFVVSFFMNRQLSVERGPIYFRPAV